MTHRYGDAPRPPGPPRPTTSPRTRAPAGHGGFGVVEMDTTQAARDAIRALDNWEFRGRTLTVRAATAAEETAVGHPRMFTSMNMGDDEEER